MARGSVADPDSVSGSESGSLGPYGPQKGSVKRFHVLKGLTFSLAVGGSLPGAWRSWKNSVFRIWIRTF
jgi:hypothetical protein